MDSPSSLSTTQSSNSPNTLESELVGGDGKSLRSWDNQCNEIIPNLFLGNINSPLNLHRLQKNGITHVYKANGKKPEFPKSKIQYLSINLRRSVDSPVEILFQAIKFIDSALKNDSACLVHCYLGASRSATVVVAYLMYRFSWNLQTAIAFAKKRRKQVFIESALERYLHDFEKALENSDK